MKSIVTAQGTLLLILGMAFNSASSHARELAEPVRAALTSLESSTSGVKIINGLTTIKSGPERVFQLLTVVTEYKMSSEVRSELAEFLFSEPVSPTGIEAEHLPLLCKFYLELEKLPADLNARPKSFLGVSGIQSRILDIVASLLSLDEVRLKLPPGAPAERMQRLLDTAVSTTKSEAIGRYVSESQHLFTVQAPSSSFNSRAQSQEGFAYQERQRFPISPWAIIVVIIAAVAGLLWLVLKRRS